MLPGDFTPGVVTTFQTRVTINGMNRPAVDVDLEGEMRSDLPSQMTRHSGSMVRQGTITWATEDDIVSREVTPFNDFGVWRPQKGDDVVVYQGDGFTEWRRFTGVVDETTGAVGTGMRSTIVADTDSLSETFSCEPLLSRMHPLPGSTAWRWAGLSPMFYVDAALRAGGYHVTEPTKANSALHVPLQTSMLPTTGDQAEILSGDSHTGSSQTAQYWGAPWGFSASNFRSTYRPAESRSPSNAVDISLMVAPNHFGAAYIDVFYGPSVRIRLMVNNDRSAAVRRENSSGWQTICQLSSQQLHEATRVEVLVKNGTATLRSNSGSEASGAISDLGSAPMSSISVTAQPDARIGSAQVSYPNAAHEFRYLHYESTAHIQVITDNTTTWGYTSASPRFEPSQAINVLEDLADQTLSAMWVDEQGVVTISPSAGLRGQSSMQTITTADDVLALAWSDRLLAVASRVTVSYKQRIVTIGNLQRVIVADGSRHTLSDGDIVEDVYRPGSDVDWYGVDDTPVRVPEWAPFNSGIGSFVGVTYYQGGDLADKNLSANTKITMRKTGISEWAIVHEAQNYPPDVTAETLTHPDTSVLWQRNRGTTLPIIRAWGKMEWSDQEVTRATGMPGPVLRVDLGAQAVVEQADQVLNYLYELIQNAVPQITELEVHPDPRRQIGDVITIRSESFLGVSLRCIITGIKESMSPHGATQSLSLEVLEVTPGALTWEQWEAAFPGTITYQQWQSIRDSTDTYQDFNTNPLEGAN